MKIFKRSLQFLFVAAIGLAASPTRADIPKKGFLIGFSLGAGQIFDRDFSNTGAMFDFYLGGSFNNQWSLMGYIDGHAGKETFGLETNSTTLTNEYMGAVGQYQPATIYPALNRAFFRLGPGIMVTRAETTYLGVTYSADRKGFGIMAQAGYNIIEYNSFAMDIDFKFIPQWYKSSEGGYDSQISGGLGFTWY